MKTYDSRYLGKKKRISRKGEGGVEFIRRMVSSLSNEKIQRIWDKHSSRVQAKLEISQPEDAAEIQADKVAEGVTQGDTKISKAALTQNPVSEINAKSEGSNMQTTDAFDSQLQSTKGQGQKLDNTIQTELEQHTGTDLSGVNIHTNSKAGKLSESINAKAFTHGQDIYFKQGQYNTISNEGKSLLAHEVAHTVQQGEGKVQPKIQRQPTATTKVRDGGERPHAEGVFHGDVTEGGFVITPAQFPITKAYYDGNSTAKGDMLKNYPGTKLLYNTFHSLAARFGIPEDKLLAANPGVAPTKIGVGKKIIIPYVLEEPMVFMPSIPVKQIPVTINLPTTLKPIQLPGNELGPVVIPDSGYANYKERKRYRSKHVQEAAYNIIKSDSKIMDAMIFLGQIKTNDPTGGINKWRDELMLFFEDGPNSRKPDLTVMELDYQGETPESNINMEEPHQEMFVNSKNEFSVSVSTYLHEMNHYIDMWYNSKAAQKILGKKRPEAEKQSGIKPVEPHDITEAEQLAAIPEYLNALLEQIMIDMKQKKKQPNEHWTVPDLRDDYKQWLKNPGGKTEADFILEKKKDLVKKMKSTYGRWGLTGGPGTLTATGVEQGYAFEKAAYGFTELADQQGVDKTKWAGNFNSNFEKRFYMYLGKN